MTALGTLTTRIAQKLLDTGNVVVSAPSIIDAVNESVRFWKRRSFWFNEFEETVVLSTNDPMLNLLTVTPLVVFENQGVVIIDQDERYDVTKVSSAIYDAANDEQQGRPYIWTYRNDGYELFYYPDEAYSAVVRGIKDYSAFATDGTDNALSNDFTDEAEDLIVYEALSRIHGGIRQDEKMEAYFRRLATDEYNNLMGFDNSKQGTGTLQTHSCLI